MQGRRRGRSHSGLPRLRRDARAVIGPLVDDALELSVIGSFSRIGPAIRRRLFGWQNPPTGALAGRTVLVTGPTSGLGLAVARGAAACATSSSDATARTASRS